MYNWERVIGLQYCRKNDMCHFINVNLMSLLQRMSKIFNNQWSVWTAFSFILSLWWCYHWLMVKKNSSVLEKMNWEEKFFHLIIFHYSEERNFKPMTIWKYCCGFESTFTKFCLACIVNIHWWDFKFCLLKCFLRSYKDCT